MRIVRDLTVLDAEIERARSEGQRYFGDGRLYVERYIENPRHIEVQVLGDGQGRSEEHTSELQALMRISYAVFCLKKKTENKTQDICKRHHLRPSNIDEVE